MRTHFFKRINLNKPRIVLLMGGPGSGKSVQASKCPQFNHISTGELLRGFITKKNNDFNKFRELLNKGDFIPDRDMIDILAREIEKIPSNEAQKNNAILLDGFPRTLQQWILHKHYFGIPTGIIDFELSPEKMLERLLHRKRMDDTLETIKHRIDTYYESTVPVATQIKNECQSSSYTIDASQPIENIHQEFENILQRLFPDLYYVNDKVMTP